MGWFRKTIFRLQPLFMKKRIEVELTDEIRTHLEMQAEANVAAGMSPEEARFAAQRQFGGVDQAKERFREERGYRWLENTWRDLRYALRQFRKAPGFTAIAILTVALGLGACTSLFSLVDGVLLRPLDYPQPQQLVGINETRHTDAMLSVAPGIYLEWRKSASVFESLTAFFGRSYNSVTAGNAVNIGALSVAANFFTVMGIQPILGRCFLPEEEQAGKEHVAILSYQVWQTQFGGREDVINETIQLNDQPYAIVGVMPDKHYILGGSIYTPAVFTAKDAGDFGSHYLGVIGRLKPGISVQQAQSEMDVISDRIARRHPDSNKGYGARVTKAMDLVTSGISLQLLVLLGAVGLLLLIACVNVAGLLLARANSRRREVAVRAALGASRGRIVRQFLCESLLIASAGGVLGIAIAYASMGALLRFASHFVPRIQEVTVNGAVLLVACGLMLLAGFTFGLMPALQSTRGDMVESLKEAGRNASGGRKRQRVRAALVIAEIALALMLLAGSGLLVLSLIAMQRADEGFKTRDVYTNGLSLSSGKKYDTPQKIVGFLNDATQRISALPDVHSIAFTNGLPMAGNMGLLFTTDAKVATSTMESANMYLVTPDYFKVMSIPFIRGRRFAAQDNDGAPRVVIVNQELAKKYFPGLDPIGQRLMILTMANTPDVWREIVGVVGDIKPFGPQSPLGPQIYEPFAQNTQGSMILVVRAKGPAPALPGAIRDIIRSLDHNLPFQTIWPYDATVAYSWVRIRFSMILFTLFSGVALLLAAIGIYGVMAYSVSQRTNEIGIRMALGAQAGDVLGMIFGSGARIVAAGLLIGVAGSLALARLLGSLLFNTSPYDPLTLVAVGLLLAAVAFLACWFPARRATKVDPVVALRAE